MVARRTMKCRVRLLFVTRLRTRVTLFRCRRWLGLSCLLRLNLLSCWDQVNIMTCVSMLLYRVMRHSLSVIVSCRMRCRTRNGRTLRVMQRICLRCRRLMATAVLRGRCRFGLELDSRLVLCRRGRCAVMEGGLCRNCL